MEAWRADKLNALLTAESEQDVFKELAGLASALGFEYCAYGIRIPIPVSRPAIAILSNYPESWQQAYKANRYLHIDPTVQHATRSTLPVVWSDELFANAGEMWEEARGHGLRVGWAHPSRDGSGALGMLTLARSATPMSRTEMAEHHAAASWITQYAHAAMSRLLTPRLAPESAVMLTVREKEVMSWTAEGKTSFEISVILSVSERTVNFHINNVVAKLGTTNKTQAAVKAVALGLLL